MCVGSTKRGRVSGIALNIAVQYMYIIITIVYLKRSMFMCMLACAAVCVPCTYMYVGCQGLQCTCSFTVQWSYIKAFLAVNTRYMYLIGDSLG